MAMRLPGWAEERNAALAAYAAKAAEQNKRAAEQMKAQNAASLAALKKQMASQPADYGYDAATNAKLDKYIKSGGKGTPESYGLGSKLLNTPGFEDPLGIEAARINARKQANSDAIREIAQQQYEDVKNIAQEQSRAFNEAYNPSFQDNNTKKLEQMRLIEDQRANDKIQRTREGAPDTRTEKKQGYKYKGKFYESYDDLPFAESERLEAEQEDRDRVNNAISRVTDSQEARNQDDTSGGINAAFRYELQRPPDQLYYIQSLGQCLNRKYSGSGVFVDD